MPKFYFQFLDGTGQDAVESEFEFEDFDAAREQARQTLGEMAREGLPDNHSNMMSVEILDAERNPLLELRLTFDELRKTRVGVEDPSREPYDRTILIAHVSGCP